MPGEPFRPKPTRVRKPSPHKRPPLRLQNTTLWEYPSQQYGTGNQGDQNYAGATPSWIIWQLLQRYTREGDRVVDPMCGSGTTLDVAKDLARHARGFDLQPTRTDIEPGDARRLPLDDAACDFVFIDPPYSTHIDYSDDERCIGKLDAGAGDGGTAYYAAMRQVIGEIHRVLRDKRYMALYVSDSFKKNNEPGRRFMPIGFELFSIMRERFEPVDIVAVVRKNQKLERGNWRKAAEEGNFFLRGFNYLFIMKKNEQSDRRVIAPARRGAVRSGTASPASARPPRGARRPSS